MIARRRSGSSFHTEVYWRVVGVGFNLGSGLVVCVWGVNSCFVVACRVLYLCISSTYVYLCLCSGWYFLGLLR